MFCCFFLCCLEEDRGVELFLSVAFAVETGTPISCGKDTEYWPIWLIHQPFVIRHLIYIYIYNFLWDVVSKYIMMCSWPLDMPRKSWTKYMHGLWAVPWCAWRHLIGWSTISFSKLVLGILFGRVGFKWTSYLVRYQIMQDKCIIVG